MNFSAAPRQLYYWQGCQLFQTEGTAISLCLVHQYAEIIPLLEGD